MGEKKASLDQWYTRKKSVFCSWVLILHSQNECILLFFFSTERKSVAWVHHHLKITVDLCIPKRYSVLCICSELPSFPLRREAQEAIAFFLTSFTVITLSKYKVAINFTTHMVNLQTDSEKLVSDSILSYLCPMELNHPQLPSMKMNDGEWVPVLSPTWYIFTCVPSLLPALGYLPPGEVLKLFFLAFLNWYF